MATSRPYRGTTIVNPDGENFTQFYGTPLPERVEDIREWAKNLLASLDTNFAALEKSIQGIGQDIRSQAAEAAVIAADAAGIAQATEAGWRDNLANLTAAATGAGTPSLQPFGPTGNIKQRRFGIGDSVYVIWHIDHDIEPGSAFFFHMHWSTDGTSTGNVAWEFNYTIAKGHNQDNFNAETTLTLEEAAAGTAWRHMVTEDTAGVITPEPDSLIIAEIKRVAPSSGSNSDDVFGLFADIHYYSDRLATPNRAPNFYN